MPITISYGSPALVGAAAFGIGREKGRLKAGAQAAKFAQGTLDRRDRTQEREQARNDRLGVLGAQMDQRERLANQQRESVDERARISGQVRASQIGAAEKRRFMDNDRRAGEMIQKRQWDLDDEARKRQQELEDEQRKQGPFARDGGVAPTPAPDGPVPNQYFPNGEPRSIQPFGKDKDNLPSWYTGIAPDNFGGDTSVPGREPVPTPQQERELRRYADLRGRNKQMLHTNDAQKQQTDNTLVGLIEDIKQNAFGVPKPTMAEKYKNSTYQSPYGPVVEGADGKPEVMRNAQPTPEQQEMENRMKLTQDLASKGIYDPDKIPGIVDKLIQKDKPKNYDEFEGGGRVYKPMHEDDANRQAAELEAQGMKVDVTKIGPGGSHGAFVTVLPQESKDPDNPEPEQYPIKKSAYVSDSARRTEAKLEMQKLMSGEPGWEPTTETVKGENGPETNVIERTPTESEVDAFLAADYDRISTQFTKDLGPEQAKQEAAREQQRLDEVNRANTPRDPAQTGAPAATAQTDSTQRDAYIKEAKELISKDLSEVTDAEALRIKQLRTLIEGK